MRSNYSFVFFGTPELSVRVLEELSRVGLVPELIVTSPDAPQGRRLVLTPPPAKRWAEAHSIPLIQPKTLKTDEGLEELLKKQYDFFVVAAYGKIIPQRLIDLPKKGVLNVHPSLLPKFRGASPIRSQILADDRDTGVSIMLIDAEMDHGPILSQIRVPVSPWPPGALELEDTIARAGGAELARVIPLWMNGEIQPAEQNHAEATFTKKIEKEDGLLDLSVDGYQNFLKIKAYEGWPGTYFFLNGKRVIIKDATYENGALRLTRVLPEGGKEMPYEEFLRGVKK
ncbi:MAG TPA: methionyl-tRNA formyltransferase [Candidatus Paceibacterota bacterium]|nr:methionyl-tRNA formyltransferase [Candidatus Paceibacterota bacterium]